MANFILAKFPITNINSPPIIHLIIELKKEEVHRKEGRKEERARERERRVEGQREMTYCSENAFLLSK